MSSFNCIRQAKKISLLHNIFSVRALDILQFCNVVSAETEFPPRGRSHDISDATVLGNASVSLFARQGKKSGVSLSAPKFLHTDQYHGALSCFRTGRGEKDTAQQEQKVLYSRFISVAIKWFAIKKVSGISEVHANKPERTDNGAMSGDADHEKPQKQEL